MDAYGTGLSDSLSTTVSDCAFNSRGIKIKESSNPNENRALVFCCFNVIIFLWILNKSKLVANIYF